MYVTRRCTKIELLVDLYYTKYTQCSRQDPMQTLVQANINTQCHDSIRYRQNYCINVITLGNKTLLS